MFRLKNSKKKKKKKKILGQKFLKNLKIFYINIGGAKIIIHGAAAHHKRSGDATVFGLPDFFILYLP